MSLDSIDANKVQKLITDLDNALKCNEANNFYSIITIGNVWNCEASNTFRNSLKNLLDEDYKKVKETLQSFNIIVNYVNDYNAMKNDIITCKNNIKICINNISNAETQIRNISSQNKYTVQWGDGLVKIAQMYNTTPDELEMLNPEAFDNGLIYGQVITVPINNLLVQQYRSEILNNQKEIESYEARIAEYETRMAKYNKEIIKITQV